MIRVFVSNDDGIKIVLALADGFQTGHNFPPADSGIKQNPGALRTNERRVTRTATRENADLDDASPPIRFTEQ